MWTGAIIAVPPSTTGITYYVDGAKGADTNDGKTVETAFKTIKKAAGLVVAGDTVLILKGLYREGINVGNRPGGTADKPITFGSYGDGEVILDISPKVTGWTRVNGSVWRAPVTFDPIAVVVNDVPLKQVAQGQGGTTAPFEGVAGVTPGSGKWFHDAAGMAIVADVGNVDPNTADIVVPKDDPGEPHVFVTHDHYTFKGLTVRGSGANGIWSYGSHTTVESCDVKFNGKAGITFMVDSAGTGNTDNTVLTSHVYHNVLRNWPRGNNGYAESGGGWSGGLAFQTNLRGIARGNIVHMNGGEGVISYGTEAGKPSGSVLFEQNVVFDNWSVNMYVDNQPDGIMRRNVIFNHPPDPANFLYAGAGYPWETLGKFTVCIMLADEEGSSDATNNYANLDRTQVYGNLLAGCRIAIRDYGEGNAHTVLYHGLKNTLIANNTIIMMFPPLFDSVKIAIQLQDNTTPSGTNRNVNTVIENNLVIGFGDATLVWSEKAGKLDGITMNYNAYFSPMAKPFRSGEMVYDFAGWKTQTGADANGVFADGLVVDMAAFRAPGPAPYDWRNAMLGEGSPARGAGKSQSAFSTNLTGASFSPWSMGAF